MFLFFNACQKESSQNDAPAINKKELTENERKLVENLGKLTEVFKELYKEKANLKVVNAAIASKAYTDESILLKDLIFPTESWVGKSVRFKEQLINRNISLDNFARNFWIEANKRNDLSFNEFLNSLNESVPIASNNTSNNVETANSNAVTIYFPYSERFLSNGTADPVITIVGAVADANEGFGSLPNYSNGVLQSYSQVTVNDNYAQVNATHIIGINGVEKVNEPQANVIINAPPPPPPPPPGVSRVYIGEAVCRIQYDAFISLTGNGGGSEMRYCHMTGYLQPVNGHVTSFQDVAEVYFSRNEISNKTIKRTYLVWDDDWIQDDLEQFLGIYEEDNMNTVTFSGSVGTTLKLDSVTTITASIGFTITRSSQDAIIRQLKISRNSYFAGAFQNQGWGYTADATFLPLPFTHGWPFYDGNFNAGANVGWTWPYNTF
jgi:hypothetical protein